MKIEDRPVYGLELQKKFKYTLRNVDKDFVKSGNNYCFVEWADEGTFKKRYDKPTLNCSLLFDLADFSYGWLTTPITEIIEQTDKLIRFKTENSEYELIIHEQQLQEN